MTTLKVNHYKYKIVEPGENEDDDKDDEDSDVEHTETKGVESDTHQYPSEPEDNKNGGNENEDNIPVINVINLPSNETLSGLINNQDNECDKNKENNKLQINSSSKPADVGAGNNKTKDTGTTRTGTTGNSQGIVKDNNTYLKTNNSIEVRKVFLKATRVTIVKLFLEIRIPISIYPTTHIPPSI